MPETATRQELSLEALSAILIKGPNIERRRILSSKCRSSTRRMQYGDELETSGMQYASRAPPTQIFRNFFLQLFHLVLYHHGKFDFLETLDLLLTYL